MPDGCELISVNVVEVGASFQPCSATYVLAVREEYLNEQLKTTIERLLASECLNVQRLIGKKKLRLKHCASCIKNIDVRVFLESIELDRGGIIVKCKISLAGSIRVDEILELLKLDAEKLALPIRRTSVKWQVN